MSVCVQPEEPVGPADIQDFVLVIWFPCMPEFLKSVWMSARSCCRAQNVIATLEICIVFYQLNYMLS